MHFKAPLPPGRSQEQILHHYLVEKNIASRLMKSNREERKLIYATMYDELFREVPDHPRLGRRESDEATRRSIHMKESLVKRFLDQSKVFLEFAPGDCRFAMAAASYAKHVFAIDISDQRANKETKLANFDLVVYDGYCLDAVASNSVDVIFSDQLIEHFHPDDTKLHFELAYRLLKSKGMYVIRTPHAFTGPHDISKYFSDVPEGFHLKEWTYHEIGDLVKEIGYSEFRPYWHRTERSIRLPLAYCVIIEKLLSRFPKYHMKALTKLLLPRVYGVAIK